MEVLYSLQQNVLLALEVGCAGSIMAHSAPQGLGICVSRLPIQSHLPLLFTRTELFSAHSALSPHEVQPSRVPILN